MDVSFQNIRKTVDSSQTCDDHEETLAWTLTEEAKFFFGFVGTNIDALSPLDPWILLRQEKVPLSLRENTSVPRYLAESHIRTM